MSKLNDTQIILLSTSSQRDSGSLYPLPATASATRVGKALATLVEGGLAVERETDVAAEISRTDGDVRHGVYVTPAGLAAIGVSDGVEGEEVSSESTEPAPATPRAAQPTKTSTVLMLLSREAGATMAELVAATGWLPHTTRAALTGLRKKGHAIERGKRGEHSCYSVVVA